MKNIYLICILIILSSYSYSQEQFRITCNYYCYYDFNTSKWSQWEESDNIFVINSNSSRDIIHYTGSGKVVTYRLISDITEEEDYQIAYALDSKGYRIKFQIYSDGYNTVKIIHEALDLIIQFSYVKE
jgi:hypothetical protein